MRWQVIQRNDNLETLRGPRYHDWLRGDIIPPWRKISGQVDTQLTVMPYESKHGAAYLIPPSDSENNSRVSTLEVRLDEVIHHINYALLLRRPILVTGDPGVGKSTFADHLAHVLGLGAPFKWSINSESVLKDGLYHYDAISHLQHAQRQRLEDNLVKRSVGDFISLGPIGASLLPWDRPRVLLIDEIDKSSYHLPNDLLNILEEGAFEIEELSREAELQELHVKLPGGYSSHNEPSTVSLSSSQIKMTHPPVIIMTSNQERDFPEAFLRRCVQVKFGRPSVEMMERIIYRHFEADSAEQSSREELEAAMVEFFKEDDPEDSLPQSTDVYLQSFFLHLAGEVPREKALQTLRRDLKRAR